MSEFYTEEIVKRQRLDKRIIFCVRSVKIVLILTKKTFDGLSLITVDSIHLIKGK